MGPHNRRGRKGGASGIHTARAKYHRRQKKGRCHGGNDPATVASLGRRVGHHLHGDDDGCVVEFPPPRKDQDEQTSDAESF